MVIITYDHLKQNKQTKTEKKDGQAGCGDGVGVVSEHGAAVLKYYKFCHQLTQTHVMFHSGQAAMSCKWTLMFTVLQRLKVLTKIQAATKTATQFLKLLLVAEKGGNCRVIW